MPSSERPPRVVIVGGGVSGLTLALATLDRAAAGKPEGYDGPWPPEVTVLEAADHPGGKVRTLHEEGFTCEWGVNGFLNKEPRTLELTQRLDLTGRLQPATPAFKKRYIYARGKLRAVAMHPVKFLLSGLLPWSAKWRLIRELWVPPRDADAGDETVADFARRRVGPGALTMLVDPMQTGIYAGDPERMSVAASFPRVVEVEQQYGSLIKGMAALARERRAAGEPLPGAGPAGHLTSFEGGMSTLIDALHRALGERVRLGEAVTGLRREGKRWLVSTAGRDAPYVADAVVLACPAHAATDVLAPLDPALARLTARVPYSPLCVASVGYGRDQVAHPLDGFGFLVPRSAGLRLLGALFTSTIFTGRAPEGSVLVRAMIGGARDPEVMDLDDDALTTAVHGELAGALGITGEPAFRRVFRHRRAIPMYTMGHAARLESIDDRLGGHPGLLITGNAYRGVSVNDCAREAHPVAERLLLGLVSGWWRGPDRKPRTTGRIPVIPE